MMAARQAGRRTAEGIGRRRPVRGQGVGGRALPPGERRALLRLVICGSLFVLLVAVKLLLPGKMAELDRTLSAVMERNIDVQAVFSAVGGLFTGDGAPSQAADAVYQAVFRPETEASKADTETEAALPAAEAAPQAPLAEAGDIPPAADEAEALPVMDLVLYSDEELPGNVSMRQAILGFDHVTPVQGALSSCFGYRAHPTEGEERFHYGVDLAADSGADIACFADGTVTAVGESSSYGKYCTVTHANGCATLYAHCSRISVSSGDAVAQGEKLGEVGETGMATGPHLHFELQKDGVYLNPIYYVETA